MVVRVASLTTVGVDGSIAKGKLRHICRSEDDAVLRTNEGSHSRVLDRSIPAHAATKTRLRLRLWCKVKVTVRV